MIGRFFKTLNLLRRLKLFFTYLFCRFLNKLVNIQWFLAGRLQSCIETLWFFYIWGSYPLSACAVNGCLTVFLPVLSQMHYFLVQDVKVCEHEPYSVQLLVWRKCIHLLQPSCTSQSSRSIVSSSRIKISSRIRSNNMRSSSSRTAFTAAAWASAAVTSAMQTHWLLPLWSILKSYDTAKSKHDCNTTCLNKNMIVTQLASTKYQKLAESLDSTITIMLLYLTCVFLSRMC